MFEVFFDDGISFKTLIWQPLQSLPRAKRRALLYGLLA